MIDSTSSDHFLIVLTTEKNMTKASSLAKEILNRKMAACVNFIEVSSNFFWGGELQQIEEVQLLIKTTHEYKQILVETIKNLHSYQEPEFLCWKANASHSYGGWIDQVVKPLA